MGQVLVEAQARLVKGDTLGGPVVGPDDGRVAAARTTAEVALLQPRDVAHAALGQLICGGQSMNAATDDDGVVGPLQLRPAPHVPGLEIDKGVHSSFRATPS